MGLNANEVMDKVTRRRESNCHSDYSGYERSPRYRKNTIVA